VAVSAYECVGIVEAILVMDAAAEIFEIDLMADADAGRDDAEGLECVHAPFQELVAFPVAGELLFHVHLEGIRVAVAVYLDGMVNDKVDGNKGLDDARIFAHPVGSAAHCGEVAEEGDPREVLEEDARDDERDLFGTMGCGHPGRELPDVCFRDLLTVAVAKDRFEHDADRDGEARDRAEPGLFEGGKGIEFPFLARAGIEFTKSVEEIVIQIGYL